MGQRKAPIWAPPLVSRGAHFGCLRWFRKFVVLDVSLAFRVRFLVMFVDKSLFLIVVTQPISGSCVGLFSAHKLVCVHTLSLIVSSFLGLLFLHSLHYSLYECHTALLPLLQLSSLCLPLPLHHFVSSPFFHFHLLLSFFTFYLFFFLFVLPLLLYSFCSSSFLLISYNWSYTFEYFTKNSSNYT